MKKIIQDLTKGECRELMLSMGEKAFRGDQLFEGITLGKSLGEISNIPKPLKEKLLETYEDSAAQIVERLISTDGTEKYLFRLADGNVIEGVLMKYKYGNTQCVSTQVGCRMGCKFCASTLGGLVRNLTQGEILSQVLLVNRLLGGTLKERKVTNIVLMGSGEPLDNYDNTVGFLRLASSPEGLNISPRNISLSTCGLVPQMRRLTEEGLPVNLTVSLHAPFDEDRKKIMPVANAYSIREILDACSYYFEKTGRRYIFEYTLIRGKNDGEAHVKELVRLLSGRPCLVNVIRLNEVKETGLVSTQETHARAFIDKLTRAGLTATLRRSAGADIQGACGQLRRKYLENPTEIRAGREDEYES